MELEVPPMAETRLLFNHIREGRPPPAFESQGPPRTPPALRPQERPRTVKRSWAIKKTPHLPDQGG
jgi:hypothetical protein